MDNAMRRDASTQPTLHDQLRHAPWTAATVLETQGAEESFWGQSEHQLRQFWEAPSHVRAAHLSVRPH
jgi:hypothetical protein